MRSNLGSFAPAFVATSCHSFSVPWPPPFLEFTISSVGGHSAKDGQVFAKAVRRSNTCGLNFNWDHECRGKRRGRRSFTAKAVHGLDRLERSFRAERLHVR